MIKNCLNSRRLSLLSWGCFDFFFISSLAEVEIERKVNTTVEKNQENWKKKENGKILTDMLFLTGKKLMVRSCNNSVSHLNVDIYLRHEHKLLDIKRFIYKSYFDNV